MSTIVFINFVDCLSRLVGYFQQRFYNRPKLYFRGDIIMVKITDKYYVETDKYNWILKEMKVVTEEDAKRNKNLKVGELMCKDQTYHATVITTLEYLFERRTKDIANECETIEEYIKKTTKMKKEFSEQLKDIVKECGELFQTGLAKKTEEND
jgi:hypothetical protein